MMRNWKSLLSVLVVLGASSGVWAAAYTWTGSGDGTSWNDPDNWSYTGVCGAAPCYPKEPGDDATIGAPACSSCGIDLVTDEIDDLTIPSGNPTFDDGETLTIDTLASGNDSTTTTITFANSTKIQN